MISALDLYRHLMEAHASEISKEIDNFLSETIAKGSVNVGIIAGTLRKDSPMAIGGLQDLLQTVRTQQNSSLSTAWS